MVLAFITIIYSFGIKKENCYLRHRQFDSHEVESLMPTERISIKFISLILIELQTCNRQGQANERKERASPLNNIIN